MTEGDVFGWLKSDDPFVYRDAVAAAVEAFEQTGADVVYGHALLIDGDNRALRVMHVPRFDPVKLERYCFLLQPSVFVRREVFEAELLDTAFSYSMDYDLWLRLRDHDWHRLDRVLAADRNHGERKTFDPESRQETVDLRRERGFTERRLFGARQFADKVDWRLRRLRGLAHMRGLLADPDEAFAVDLERPPLSAAVRSQLYGRKGELA
jgi:GT2 family glycosyltransferase